MKQKKTIKNEGITSKYAPFINFSLLAKVAICVIFSFSTTVATAQKASKDKPVRQLPEFIGGPDSLAAFFNANFKSPEDAKTSNITGMVYVNFVVEVDGRLTEIKVKRGIGGGYNDASIQLVSLMSGKWLAGKENGQPVRMEVTFPIKFSAT